MRVTFIQGSSGKRTSTVAIHIVLRAHLAVPIESVFQQVFLFYERSISHILLYRLSSRYPLAW